MAKKTYKDLTDHELKQLHVSLWPGSNMNDVKVLRNAEDAADPYIETHLVVGGHSAFWYIESGDIELDENYILFNPFVLVAATKELGLSYADRPV